MPPRLNKRQIREQEELLALDATAQDQDSSAAESDEDVPRPSKAPAIGFAAVRLDRHDECSYLICRRS